MRPVRRATPNIPLPILDLGLCWLMLALCWLCWPYAGLMLALCWLYVGLCWIKLGQVGSCWLKLAQVGLKMRLCWLLNLRKSPEHTFQGLQKAKFPWFLIQNWLFWNTQNLQNIEKSICFIGPFAICTFLLLLMLVWVSKLVQVRSKLAHVGLLEQIGVQVEPSWHQLGSRCVNFVPSWPPKKSVSEWGKNQLVPSWPQICCWRSQVPLPEGVHINSPSFHNRTRQLT